MGCLILISTLSALSWITVSACLAPLGLAGCTDEPPAGASVRATNQMGTARATHTATLLRDGRVLIAGGFGNGETFLKQAEVYVSSKSAFKSAEDLMIRRSSHTASLLPDGRVLIVGGYNGEYLDSTEIFDPKTGRFSAGARMTIPRSGHTATTLSDGRILISGGVGTGWTFLADAEIYDPKTARFTRTGKMAEPRESHTATLLTDGRVLITGGHKGRREAMTVFKKTEIYDVSRGTFADAGEMTIKRHKHDAIRLLDGRVLILGGADERDSRGAYTSLEIFDPGTERFTKIGDMNTSRYKLNGAVVRLKTGHVLIAGGSDTAELFDPSSLSVKRVDGDFGSDRLFASATLLRDGRVLIAGGYDRSISVGNGAWIFDDGAKAK